MDKNSIHKVIEEAICAVYDKFMNDPSLILTEHDLQCLLFEELRERLGDTHTINTEIVWSNLKKPDISIFPKGTIQVYKKEEAKKLGCRYYFDETNDKDAILMELKFLGVKDNSKRAITMIKEDIDKIHRLRTESPCYFVAFCASEPEVVKSNLETYIDPNKDHLYLFDIFGSKNT